MSDIGQGKRIFKYFIHMDHNSKGTKGFTGPLFLEAMDIIRFVNNSMA
jgi:hypothetical protein